MRSAVVFYSLDGNTEAAARKIADIAKADIFELKAKTSWKGAMRFVMGGFQAVTNQKAKVIDDFHSQVVPYETVYIGTPVWGSHGAPAVNTFVNKAGFTGKDVYIFFLCASPEADYRPKGGIDYLSRIIKKKGGTLKGIYVWHGGAPGKPPDKKSIGEQVRRALQI